MAFCKFTGFDSAIANHWAGIFQLDKTVQEKNHF